MHIILILLFLFLFFVFIVPTLILSLIAKIIAFFGRGTKRANRSDNDAFRQDAAGGSSRKKVQNKKIFDKDEGEYVDFEEIK